MMNKLSIDELLNKAFSLACFIVGRREDAVRTVEEAMARLDVTTAAQGKRLYYKSSASTWVGHEKADRYRNKVLFSEVHLLQRLVYITSEPYEQQQEQSSIANPANEEQMLIHYIKHLVRITTRRNSFYVTLGLSRLLYNYTTAETMEVYNAVIQDPERVKDDYYYRSRKGVLMQELKNRFGRLLEVARGPRGEERFRAAGQQGPLTGLVAECLSYFTPWYTPCLIPAGVDPIMDGITSLSSRGQKEEDRIEVDRNHAVLHPDCHERLIDSLGFESLTQRLEAPHFLLSANNGRGGGTNGRNDRRQPAALDQDELEEIKGHLDDQSSRRKRAFAGLLRVVVDGSERARLDLSRSSDARFTLDDDAEILEVRTMTDGGDLLLATHLFTHDETLGERRATNASIVLEGGQKLTIAVASGTHTDPAVVNVAYRETRILRAAALYLRRFTKGSAPAESLDGRRRAASRVPSFAIGFALIAILAFGVVQVLRTRDTSPTHPDALTSNQQVNVPAVGDPPLVRDGDKAPPVISAPVNEPDKGVRKKSQPRSSTPPSVVQPPNNGSQRTPVQQRPVEKTVARKPESSEPRSTEPERNRPPTGTTRTVPRGSEALTLAGVRKIYVETRGDAALLERVRDQFSDRLQGTNRFMPVGSKDDADGLLRLSVKSIAGTPGNIAVDAQLINARGETIWKKTGTGLEEIVAAGVIEGLLGDAKKAEEERR
jgi:hypothetical protein